MIEVVNNGFTKINELNTDDIDQCLDLLAKSFPGNSYYDSHNKMNFFFKNEPELKCLVLKENDKCIGIQCIVDRIFRFFEINCSASGLSYTAIKPNYQNSDAANLIKKHMFKYIEENSDLSFGFARKVLDNYWYPYGYRGITNFCEISLLIKSIFLSNTDVVSRIMRTNDIALVNKYYNDIHSEMLGPLLRKKELWEYYLEKFKKGDIKIFVMDLNKEPIGYYIINGGVVYEIGYDLKYSKQVFVHIMHKLKNLGYDEIIFKIGKNHPMIDLITRYEHSIRTRFVWRGGHILRVTSIDKYFNKIINVLEDRAKNTNLSDFEFSCNSFHFSYIDKKLSITSNNQNTPNIIFDEHEWTKLIFGACKPKLLNGYDGDNNGKILSILFPICNPQFLEIDQL